MRQVVAYKRLRTMEKVVAVAYRRWSFTRGSNCNALTGKVLVFWIAGCLLEVVAHKGSTVVHLTISMERRGPRPYGLLLRLRLLTSFESVRFCQNVYLISSTTKVRWLDSADNALLGLHNSSDHTWPLGLIRSSWPHSIISTYHWVGNHKKYWSVAFI